MRDSKTETRLRIIHTPCAGVILSFTLIATAAGQVKDVVDGNLILLNENGTWSWYQDERAVVDTTGGRLFVGSNADESGTGGAARGGDVDAVVFDLETRTSTRTTLKQGGGSAWFSDDHNAPAFLVRPDGRALSMYAAHFNDTSSYYRVYDGTWGSETKFNWKQERPGGSNFQTTYSNLIHLSAPNRTYNFVRGNNKSPNFMVSGDFGRTWEYGGQLTANEGVGYNNGYYKYWGNGVDRIDILFTEYHPRDYNTSVYHGYVRGDRSYATNGMISDSNIFGLDSIPTPEDFTKVFSAGTVVKGAVMTRCWNIDLVRYDDGTIAAIIKARANDTPDSPANNPDNRLLYSRYNGIGWTTSYLCKAGPKLYASEQDYTGLGALHPHDPSTIYISTTIDPRDDATNLVVHEIFKGVTTDGGLTWTWEPITERSSRENLRPIVPAWDENNTALLWWRGMYSSAQTFDAAVVGIIETRGEAIGQMSYVDADVSNTSFANGSAFVPIGPGSGMGPDDDRWYQRTGFGNGGSVLTSSESGNGENALGLTTRVPVPAGGTYDFWVNFWGELSADWRIMSGLSSDRMQVFRHRMCRQVSQDEYADSILVSTGTNIYLYQGYVGRVTVANQETVEVFVDDNAIQTGTTSTSIGNTARTWYDGVSYSPVSTGGPTAVRAKPVVPVMFSLGQNYPNPFNPATRIPFELSARAHVELSVFDILGRKIATLVDETRPAGRYEAGWVDTHVPTGVYICRMTTGGNSRTMMMTLVR